MLYLYPAYIKSSDVLHIICIHDVSFNRPQLRRARSLVLTGALTAANVNVIVEITPRAFCYLSTSLFLLHHLTTFRIKNSLGCSWNTLLIWNVRYERKIFCTHRSTVKLIKNNVPNHSQWIAIYRRHATFSIKYHCIYVPLYLCSDWLNRA